MCPPGVDQTERGPQRWHVLAPRIHKIHSLVMDHNPNTYGTYKPTDFLFSDTKTWDAWSKLAVPGPFPQSTIARSHNRSNRFGSHQLSKLESLPSELLAAVIADPGLEKRDLIALAATSETLWAHVLPRVEKECSLAQPPLAGVELACTGTYLLSLPESFLENDLAARSVTYSRWGAMSIARKINWAAASEYTPIGPTPGLEWQEAWKAHANSMGFPDELVGKLGAEFLGRCSPERGTTQDALWVLRNLTTKEYVRCIQGDGISGVRGFVDSEDERVKLRVEDVLLMRICWSRMNRWENRDDLGITQGKWAGHCFDIVPQEYLGEGEGWTDSTDDVLWQAREIAEKLDRNYIWRENAINEPKKTKSEAEHNSKGKMRKIAA